MKKKIHLSRHIALICVGILVGLVISRQYESISLVYLVISCALIVTAIRKPYLRVLPLALLAGVILGMWRGSSIVSQSAIVDQLLGEQVVVRGKLAEDVSIGKDSKLIIKLEDIVINEVETPGQLLFTTDNILNLYRSDSILIQGQLSQPIGGYIGSVYRGDVMSIERTSELDAGLKARNWFAAQLSKVMNEEHIGFALGLLVGSKSNIDEEFANNLRTVGLTHIIVASGFNLTVLVGAARKIFSKVSRYSACLAGATLIVSFIIVSGLSPSMLRAGFVASLSLLAWYFGKKISPIIILLIVASATAWISPFYVWGDGGWYLSFLAFYGVLVVAPLIEKLFFSDKRPNILRTSFVETVSAVIMTSPYVLYMFGEFSFVAVFANILIVPLVPLCMILIVLSGVFAYVARPLGEVLGFLSDSAVEYVVIVSRYFSGLEPDIALGLTKPAMIVLYVCIFGGSLLITLKNNEKRGT